MEEVTLVTIGEGETHVPIPNTLVKPLPANGSWVFLPRESRLLPVPRPSKPKA